MGSQFHDGRFHTHHFALGLSKQGTQNAGYETERRPIAFRTRVFRLSPIDGRKSKQHALGSQFHDGRFHTRPFCPGLFQAGQKDGMKPNVVQLRFKTRFFDFRPSMGESRKNTLGIAIPRRSVSYPSFCPGLFQAQGKKPGMKPNVVQLRFKTRFFDFRPSMGESRKNTLRIAIPRRSVSYYRLLSALLFQAQGKKPGMKPNVVQLRFKTRFFVFAPIGAKVQKTPLGSQYHDGRFHTTGF